jgi:hypothetical protein
MILSPPKRIDSVLAGWGGLMAQLVGELQIKTIILRLQFVSFFVFGKSQGKRG